MIIPSIKKILIVPEFGVGAEDEAMVTLKETIDADWNFNTKIVDLRQMVIDEYPGEELKDSKVIELAARKLESLANDKSIVWDKSDDCVDDPLFDSDFDVYIDDAGFEDDADSKTREADDVTTQGEKSEESDEAPFRELPLGEEDVGITQEKMKKAFSRGLRIRKTVTSREELGADEPDLLVVFGKSVMLAGGVKDKPILFIIPEYDSEWPWKKQYYVDRDAARDFFSQYVEKMNEPEDIQVLWVGAEVRRRPEPTLRYGIFTNNNNPGIFHDRYCNLWTTDEELDGNPEKLAKTVFDFADGKMEFPLFEIYQMDKDAYWVNKYPEICSFDEPVDLGYATVLGLERGVPMANGQSGIKLRVTDRAYPIPLEGIRDRKGLTALRDAVAKAVEKLPQRKRILIVPDYFSPYNAPNVIELRDQLRSRGYYVAEFVPGNTLEQSQRGIERRCKKKPFDLIVTLETGCLLASRIMNAPRIFVNPDWAAWEWMKLTLGEDKNQCRTRGSEISGPFWLYKLNSEEILQARTMGARSCILRGKHCSYGWFSEDNIEGSRLTEEHMKRFNICAYVPHLRLDTEEGIRVLAKEIDKIIKIDEDRDDN